MLLTEKAKMTSLQMLGLFLLLAVIIFSLIRMPSVFADPDTRGAEGGSASYSENNQSGSRDLGKRVSERYVNR
jgi:hypothetical protein